MFTGGLAEGVGEGETAGQHCCCTGHTPLGARGGFLGQETAEVAPGLHGSCLDSSLLALHCCIWLSTQKLPFWWILRWKHLPPWLECPSHKDCQNVIMSNYPIRCLIIHSCNWVCRAQRFLLKDVQNDPGFWYLPSECLWWCSESSTSAVNGCGCKGHRALGALPAFLSHLCALPGGNSVVGTINNIQRGAGWSLWHWQLTQDKTPPGLGSKAHGNMGAFLCSLFPFLLEFLLSPWVFFL